MTATTVIAGPLGTEVALPTEHARSGEDRSSAIFDVTLTYRYRLTRSWGDGAGAIAWVMLNPSTAEAGIDDPTIRRVVGFSRSWGFAACLVVNLFAFRSSDPKALVEVADPVGPHNDLVVERTISGADAVVAAWGNGGALLERGAVMRRLLGRNARQTFAIGMTAAGEPRHPLYVRRSAIPHQWDPSTGDGED